MDNLCVFCGNKISLEDTFCSKCGNKILDKDRNLSKKQKIKIYSLSVLLAPLGFYWFFRYFRDSEESKRKVAFNALYITIFMIIVIFVLTYSFLNSLNKYMGSIDTYGLGF